MNRAKCAFLAAEFSKKHQLSEAASAELRAILLDVYLETAELYCQICEKVIEKMQPLSQ